MDNQDVVTVVNRLIETSKDGEYGFRTCAERADSPQMKQLFSQRAVECGASAAELQTLVTQHGGTPEESGTAAGALHRGWVSMKDAVTGGSDDLALLEECERGEDSALASYRKALKETLPPSVRATIERQLSGVQRNHDQIKALRDARKVDRKIG